MSKDPERIPSPQALRAQAGSVRPVTTGSRRLAPPRRPFPISWMLLIGLLVGAVIGASLALASIPPEPGLLWLAL